MKRGLLYSLGVCLIWTMSLFTSCDVHEWPDEAPVVPLYVELEHVTAWDTLNVPFSRAGRPITDYNIRYSIRAYPLDELGNYSRVPVREFVFTRDMGEELDNRFFLEGATGMKTGHTDEAGYCLAASAERDGIQLIAIVMHADSANGRFEDAHGLLTVCFDSID